MMSIISQICRELECTAIPLGCPNPKLRKLLNRRDDTSNRRCHHALAAYIYGVVPIGWTVYNMIIRICPRGHGVHGAYGVAHGGVYVYFAGLCSSCTHAYITNLKKPHCVYWDQPSQFTLQQMLTRIREHTAAVDKN